MNKLKQDILDILCDDARTPAATVAVMLGAEESVVRKEIETMESDGTIVKYTALVNRDNTEQSKVEAFIELRVTPSRTSGFDGIAEEICAFDEVKSCFLMSGGYDFALIVEGNSLKDVALFVSEKLSGLDRIVTTATHFILKRYKSGGIMMAKPQGSKRLAVHA